MPTDETGKLARDKREEIAIEEVRRALKGLKYGSVTVIVQDGVVVQIERTSKVRPDYSAGEVAEGEGI